MVHRSSSSWQIRMSGKSPFSVWQRVLYSGATTTALLTPGLLCQLFRPVPEDPRACDPFMRGPWHTSKHWTIPADAFRVACWCLGARGLGAGNTETPTGEVMTYMQVRSVPSQPEAGHLFPVLFLFSTPSLLVILNSWLPLASLLSSFSCLYS